MMALFTKPKYWSGPAFLAMSVTAAVLGMAHYVGPPRHSAEPSLEVATAAREVTETATAIAFDNRPDGSRRWVRLCMAHRPNLQQPEVDLRLCLAASHLVFP